MRRVFNCDSACTICDKAQYKEASFTDKLCLLMHMITCKSCRDYVRNNRKLTKRVHTELAGLDPEVKAEMQRKIDLETKKESKE